MAAISGNNSGLLTGHSILDQETGEVKTIKELFSGASPSKGKLSLAPLKVPKAFFDYRGVANADGSFDHGPVPNNLSMIHPFEIYPGVTLYFTAVATKEAAEYSLSLLIDNKTESSYYTTASGTFISPGETFQLWGGLFSDHGDINFGFNSFAGDFMAISDDFHISASYHMKGTATQIVDGFANFYFFITSK